MKGSGEIPDIPEQNGEYIMQEYVVRLIYIKSYYIVRNYYPKVKGKEEESKNHILSFCLFNHFRQSICYPV